MHYPRLVCTRNLYIVKCFGMFKANTEKFFHNIFLLLGQYSEILAIIFRRNNLHCATMRLKAADYDFQNAEPKPNRTKEITVRTT